MKAARYYSLDVFRGATVALMILVNNPGTWSAMFDPLEHAEWHGCTPTDLVFPAFLFIGIVASNQELERTSLPFGAARPAGRTLGCVDCGYHHHPRFGDVDSLQRDDFGGCRPVIELAFKEAAFQRTSNLHFDACPGHFFIVDDLVCDCEGSVMVPGLRTLWYPMGRAAAQPENWQIQTRIPHSSAEVEPKLGE